MKKQTPLIAANGPGRRSTRIMHEVPLIVSWVESDGQAHREENTTLSINCHGCRYVSPFRVPKNTKIAVEIDSGDRDSAVCRRQLRARVTWVRKSRRLAGLYQIGIEFEIPQDIWQVEDSPEDWSSFPTTIHEDAASVVADVERLLQLAHAGTYYELLDVQADAARAEIKRHFYQFARRFHPDRHMDHPERVPRLQALMDSLTLAYKTLSDDGTRKQYDLRLAQTQNCRPGYGKSETRWSALECSEYARECLAAKNYAGSILWLRRAIEVEPHSPQYRTMLGRSLATVPEYRHEAIEQFEKAIDMVPANLDVHFQYAQLLEQMNLPWRARVHYLHVLELDAHHCGAREHLRRLDATGPRSTSRYSLLRRLTGLR